MGYYSNRVKIFILLLNLFATSFTFLSRSSFLFGGAKIRSFISATTKDGNLVQSGQSGKKKINPLQNSINKELSATKQKLKLGPNKYLNNSSAISPTPTIRKATAAVVVAAAAVEKISDTAPSDNDNLPSFCIEDEHFRDNLRVFRKANSPKKLFNYVQELHSASKFTQNMTAYSFRTLQRMDRNDLCIQLLPFWRDIINVNGNVNGNGNRNRSATSNSADADKIALKIEGEGEGKVEVEIEVEATLALFKGFVRMQRLDLAEEVAQLVGVHLNMQAAASSSPSSASSSSSSSLMKVAAALLPELSLAYATTGYYFKSISILQTMKRFDFKIDVETSKNILRLFLRSSSSISVREVMKVLIQLDGLDDNDSIQLLTSSFLRSIEFVKGAVSMDTLPLPSDEVVLNLLSPSMGKGSKGKSKNSNANKGDNDGNSNSDSDMKENDIPEVAFIGRSNVGKSSLINMICNRKGLAFTSKTPGKTSEFNYFLAQGVVGGEKIERTDKAMNMNENYSDNENSNSNSNSNSKKSSEKSKFYLVDLPGVGYAEVSRSQKEGWLALLKKYVSERTGLRALFHLIDSRHGLLEADEQCLSLLQDLPETVLYVIVMTKADKRGGGVKKGIVEWISKEVLSRTSRHVPIVMTSSETREGGVAMWSVILDSIYQ